MKTHSLRHFAPRFGVAVAAVALLGLTACVAPTPPTTGDCSAPAAPGVDWHGCDKSDAYLVGANLTNANLTDADLSGASLTGANLTGTKLAGADLTWVRSGGILSVPASLPAQWTLIAGHLVGPGADLRHMYWGEAKTVGLNLRHADLRYGNLEYVELVDANLTGADLSGALLSGANLSGADLTNAYLYGAIGSPANTTGITYDNTTCPNGTVVPPGTCW